MPRNANVPEEVENLKSEGEEAYNKAIESFDSGNYAEAMKKAREAIRKFNEALKKLSEIWEVSSVVEKHIKSLMKWQTRILPEICKDYGMRKYLEEDIKEFQANCQEAEKNLSTNLSSSIYYLIKAYEKVNSIHLKVGVFRDSLATFEDFCEDLYNIGLSVMVRGLVETIEKTMKSEEYKYFKESLEKYLADNVEKVLKEIKDSGKELIREADSLLKKFGYVKLGYLESFRKEYKEEPGVLQKITLAIDVLGKIKSRSEYILKKLNDLKRELGDVWYDELERILSDVYKEIVGTEEEFSLYESVENLKNFADAYIKKLKLSLNQLEACKKY